MVKFNAGLFLRILIVVSLGLAAGCAAGGAAKTGPTGGASPLRHGVVVKPGDVAEIDYQCRLKSGEVAAATGAVVETDPKSSILLSAKGSGPVSVTAVKPDEPLKQRLWAGIFEAEIHERIARRVTGMTEGETRRVELTAEMVKPKDDQSGFARLSRVRTRAKEMKMPRKEYEIRARKAPEVGQSFAVDPSFPGKVVSVAENEVIIRFSAKPGEVIATPFGPGLIREETDSYKVEIDARQGSLVRTGNSIGRIISVTDRVITIDYRHPFGYEALVCDIKVDKVTSAEENKQQSAKSCSTCGKKPAYRARTPKPVATGQTAPPLTSQSWK